MRHATHQLRRQLAHPAQNGDDSRRSQLQPWQTPPQQRYQMRQSSQQLQTSRQPCAAAFSGLDVTLMERSVRPW